MMKAVELRKGRTVVYGDRLCVVHEATHVAKGNKRSYMQVKLKDLKAGTINEIRFSVDERVETPYLEAKEFEFLYRDGENFVLMDTTTFDQVTVDADVVGEAVLFLRPNERVKCQEYEGQLISFELPIVVELEITDTPPVVKGATATNQPKEAIVETGAKVRVPGFIAPGEKIRVDSRTGEYLERVK
ncbi:MAG TPA: elongation factor P [Phycisphaerae bacterium]|nr:elongation factor P [Phycisphaerae bacterium]